MTEMEKIVVSAYTGYVMTDFNKVHEYAERMVGRPIFTHEFGDNDVQCEITAAAKEDFLALCKDEFPPSFVGRI